MSSTFSTNLNLQEPATGDLVNAWGPVLNSNAGIVDQAMGSSTTISLSNSNVTLTVPQAAYFLIILTGTLTGNVQLIFPATIGGGRHIFNQCTGAFTVTALNGASDPGGGVLIPQGYPMPIVLTANEALYDNYSAVAPGTFQTFGGANIPPGFLLCYGQTLSQTTYPLLYAALGTAWGPAAGGNFTAPDLRGRLLAGADNMGGSAAGRLTSYVLGTTGGAQTVALSAANLPSHTHNYSGTTGTDSPDHEHTFPYQNQNSTGGANTFNGVAGGTSGTVTTSGASARHQHAYSGATDGGPGTSTPTANVQPTAACNIMIRY